VLERTTGIIISIKVSDTRALIFNRIFAEVDPILCDGRLRQYYCYRKETRFTSTGASVHTDLTLVELQTETSGESSHQIPTQSCQAKNHHLEYLCFSHPLRSFPCLLAFVIEFYHDTAHNLSFPGFFWPFNVTQISAKIQRWPRGCPSA
jgi:hypothetical protein